MAQNKTLYQKVEKYLNSNYMIINLQKRYRNEVDSRYSMPYQDLISITNIDEYMYKLMLNNFPNKINSPLDIYLKELTRELETEPTLLLSLPIAKLDLNILRKYIPNIDRIRQKILQKNNELKNIFRLYMKNPNLVTTEEFKKLLIYLSYRIPYTDEPIKIAIENFAKKILNNPPRNVDNFYVAKFLIKFFGYKKCKQEGLKETKILVAKDGPHIRGLSTDDDMVVINKLFLDKISLSNNQLSDRSKRTTSGETEILGILHTVYHELRHQKQTTNAKKGELNDISLFMATRNIICWVDNEFDYNTNYKCYEIEKDANIKAWEDIEKLIKTYMPSHNLERVTRNILQHRMNEELEQLTGTRKDKNNKVFLSNTLLVKLLDEAFIKKTNTIWQEYKQFSLFYKQNGIPKREIDLLTIPLTYEFKEFYFAQTSYRSRMPETCLRESDIAKLTISELLTVINNLKILMDTTESKLNKICDRVPETGTIDKGTMGNIISDQRYAVYLSTITNRILARYPSLYNNLSVKNSISSMNNYINMINNNPLVAKFVRVENKIVPIRGGR